MVCNGQGPSPGATFGAQDNLRTILRAKEAAVVPMLTINTALISA